MTLAAPVWSEAAARVLFQEDRGAAHMWLEVEIASAFEPPAPGQFMLLRLPSSRSAAFLPRPMSVASVRRGEPLRVGFLYVPMGTGTAALAALGPGAVIDVLGPLGAGFPLERLGHPVLVAGGRGVAPLLFAAERLHAMGRACTFLFGARSHAQLVGLDDARRLVEAGGGRLLACTDDGSAGRAGDVIGLLDDLEPRVDPIVIHACGPHAMLHAVGKWSAHHGVTAYVAMESDMACGTGVCRGCPLPRSARGHAAAYGAAVPSLYGNREYALCCTDGPVFEAGDLDWERIE